MKLVMLAMAMGIMTMGGGADARADTKTATFAGGCFWCMESEFESEKGVSGAVSGYAGKGARPSYEQVSTGETGFVEAVQVSYDPSVVTYDRLLEIFWNNVDPFDPRGQFCDKGSQYVAAIYPHDDAERVKAEESVKAIETKFGKTVATKILPLEDFYEAEEHHQDFYKKNPLRYKSYKNGCGRNERLKEVWGDK